MHLGRTTLSKFLIQQVPEEGPSGDLRHDLGVIADGGPQPRPEAAGQDRDGDRREVFAHALRSAPSGSMRYARSSSAMPSSSERRACHRWGTGRGAPPGIRGCRGYRAQSSVSMPI